MVYPDEDCIVVEDHIGRAERITYANLKDIFLSTKSVGTNISLLNNSKALQQERSFDLLILAIKNDKKTANFFTKELMIPHIITFQFKNKEKDFKHKLYEDECIDWFSQNFYDEIVDGSTIKDAFNTAYTKTFDYLSASFFDSKDNQYIIDLIGVGPVLLPEDQDHNISLYGTSQNVLPEGRVEDVSKARSPTNVQKLITPFVGRNNDIDAMSQILVNEKCHFVKVCGEPGIGKTSFTLQLAYFFLTHGLFPNGIFYFSLKHILDSNKELTDVMKEIFGSKFENNIKNFFRGKKMLLIFDDFDLFYDKNLRFPRLVFCTLKECKISTIVVTNLQTMTPTLKKGKRYDHEQKQKIIEGEFIKTEHILAPLSKEEMAHLLLSLANADLAANCSFEMIRELPVLKKIGGNPSALIEKLLDNEIHINKKRLEVNPYYTTHLNIDEVIVTQDSLQTLPRSVLNLSTHSINASFENTRAKAVSLKLSSPLLSATLREAYGEHVRRKSSKNTTNKFEDTYTPKMRKKAGILTQIPKKGSLKNILLGRDLIHNHIIEEDEKAAGNKELQMSKAIQKKLTLDVGEVIEHSHRKKSGDVHSSELGDQAHEKSIATRISQKFGPKFADLIVESPEKQLENMKFFGEQHDFASQLPRSRKNFEEDVDNEKEDEEEENQEKNHHHSNHSVPNKNPTIFFTDAANNQNSQPIQEGYVEDVSSANNEEEDEEEEKVHATASNYNKVIESLLPDNGEVLNDHIDYGFAKHNNLEQINQIEKVDKTLLLQKGEKQADTMPSKPDDSDKEVSLGVENDKNEVYLDDHEGDQYSGDD